MVQILHFKVHLDLNSELLKSCVLSSSLIIAIPGEINQLPGPLERCNRVNTQQERNLSQHKEAVPAETLRGGGV